MRHTAPGIHSMEDASDREEAVGTQETPVPREGAAQRDWSPAGAGAGRRLTVRRAVARRPAPAQSCRVAVGWTARPAPLTAPPGENAYQAHAAQTTDRGLCDVSR